jgi:hypothetical protein
MSDEDSEKFVAFGLESDSEESPTKKRDKKGKEKSRGATTEEEARKQRLNNGFADAKGTKSRNIKNLEGVCGTHQ